MTQDRRLKSERVNVVARFVPEYSRWERGHRVGDCHRSLALIEVPSGRCAQAQSCRPNGKKGAKQGEKQEATQRSVVACMVVDENR